MTSRTLAVEMRGITKIFPDVVALDNVDFFVESGEIHALLGENGAGKTTLMNILYGFRQMDKGEIRVYGEKVTFKTPREAMARGIFMVSQHFSLVEDLTPWENIAMVLKTTGLTLSKDDIISRAKETMEKYGINIENLEKRVKKLSVIEKQKLEILKALICEGSILIFDEPTSVLPPQEVDTFLNTIKELNRKGKTIIYVTHKIREVYEIADRVTVLRLGKNVGTFNVTDVKPEDLIKLIIGGDRRHDKMYEAYLEGSGTSQRLSTNPTNSEVILELINVLHYDRKEGIRVEVERLFVRRGEIVGIAGLANSGQKPLVECILGVRKINQGIIKFKEMDITKLPPHRRVDLGISLLPEDRMVEGIYPELSVQANAVAGYHKVYPLKELKEIASKIVKEFNVKAESLKTSVIALSGGNIQRLLVGKVLNRGADLYILFHPTRGLDIKSTISIHERILEKRSKGKSIMLISEDLDELVKLSDRIIVMFEGRINGVVERTERGYDLYEIGKLMTGGSFEK